jgi:hypothetical protein
MGSNRNHSLIARVRGTWAATDEDYPGREVREQRALRHGWGVAGCDRCGKTLVLGEPAAHVRLNGRDVLLCPECMEPAREVPTWVAAPAARPDRVPVRLGTPQTDLRRVA